MPKQYLSAGTVVEDVNTGCRGCATGAGGNKNIFGNKYGQYLAAIQASPSLWCLMGSGLRLGNDDDDEGYGSVGTLRARATVRAGPAVKRRTNHRVMSWADHNTQNPSWSRVS